MTQKRRSDKQWLLKTARETYGTEADHPFSGDTDTAVLRHALSRKWYGLVMHVPYRRMGLDREGGTDVLNLKCSPILAGNLREQAGILPAYHMNKNSWISVLLDGTVPKKTVRMLLDVSFELTSGKTKSARSSGFRISHWIVPANPRLFDLAEVTRTDENGTFLFKQSSSVCVGDTVYLYVAAPVSGITFQCEAVETDIPCDYADEHVTVRKLMRLKVLKAFDPPVGLALLREHGVTTVRGPRGMPLSLREEIAHRWS